MRKIILTMLAFILMVIGTPAAADHPSAAYGAGADYYVDAKWLESRDGNPALGAQVKIYEDSNRTLPAKFWAPLISAVNYINSRGGPFGPTYSYYDHTVTLQIQSNAIAGPINPTSNTFNCATVGLPYDLAIMVGYGNQGLFSSPGRTTTCADTAGMRFAYVNFNHNIPPADWSDTDLPPNNKWDIKALVVHELTHALGFRGLPHLGHFQKGTAACGVAAAPAASTPTSGVRFHDLRTSAPIIAEHLPQGAPGWCIHDEDRDLTACDYENQLPGAYQTMCTGTALPPMGDEWFGQIMLSMRTWGTHDTTALRAGYFGL